LKCESKVYLLCFKLIFNNENIYVLYVVPTKCPKTL
jgi:hypothetical protein